MNARPNGSNKPEAAEMAQFEQRNDTLGIITMILELG
jgi:hypothetical protein